MQETDTAVTTLRRIMTTKKKPLSPLAKRLDKVPGRELHAALGRRSHKRFKEQAPELLEERKKKRAATLAIRAKYCQHTFLQPKVRAKGPNIGLLCCPSCNAPLEEWVTWLPKAKCRDPRRVGCAYEGRCWVLNEPGKAPRCMPCPECGGFEFEAVVKVDRSEFEGVLTGETK
jgi:hypothetical protein